MTTPTTTSKWTRTSIWLLCIAATVLWLVGATVSVWLHFASKGVNTGALDDIIYTASMAGTLLCWLLAAALSWFKRRSLSRVSVWLPLCLPLALIALKLLATQTRQVQEKKAVQAAVSGDWVQGYIKAESQTKEKVILAYFMDFPGPPPDDAELLKPVVVTPMGPNYIGTEYGVGGPVQTSATGNYSLNQPKRLRWYIWHVKQQGQVFKDKNGVEQFDDNIHVDPKVPVVVCEATVPVYVSPIRDQIEAELIKEAPSRSKDNWRSGHVELVATFYTDGRTFTLTAPWGYLPKQQPEYSADILQHQHQGDCK